MVEHVPNCEALIRGEVVSQRAAFKEHAGEIQVCFSTENDENDFSRMDIFFSDIIGENSF